jgi:hypothetical protein
MPKLVAFNTSYVTDCHASQFNNFMSESTSILQKAIDYLMYKESQIIKVKKTNNPLPTKISVLLKNINEPLSKIKILTEKQTVLKKEIESKSNMWSGDTVGKENLIINLNTELKALDNQISIIKTGLNGIYSEIALQLRNDNMIGSNLDTFRMRMADHSTSYLSKIINNSQSVDFIALIEQSVHVPETNHAYYDSILLNPFDLTEKKVKNTDYGILKRITKLGLHDIDSPNLNETKKYEYACVYDNVVSNYAIVNGKAAVSEGIAIVFKKSLFDVQMKWTNTDSTHLEQLSRTYSLNKTQKKISYYSADSGPAICTEANLVTVRGTPDGGRPIIMTAGYNSESMTLHIFVAIHGPNIPQLLPKNKYELELELSKKNPKYEPNFTKHQLKNVYDETVDELFIKVANSITNFINEGLSNSNTKIDKPPTKVLLYLGGDFNDPRGLILKTLMEKPIIIDCTINSVKLNIPVSFKNHEAYLSNKINEQVTPTTTQARYTNLQSCCANADSLKVNEVDILKTRNPFGAFNGRFDIVNTDDNLVKFLENFFMKPYPEGFTDPENYGYNGDYALFGDSSDDTYNQTLDIEKKDELKIFLPQNTLPTINIYSSDHLPVVSNTYQIQKPVGGKRRTRKNKRKTKQLIKHKKMRSHKNHFRKRRYSFRK